MGTKPETKFILNGANVVPVVEIGDDYLVPADVMFKKEQHTIYESRLDARFFCMLKELEKGKALEDYKKSKYFKYYVERLKKEYQEYII